MAILLPESDLVKLIQDGFVESLTDIIGLRALSLHLGMIDVVQCILDLKIVSISLNVHCLNDEYKNADSIT
jgi:hypothetical protein